MVSFLPVAIHDAVEAFVHGLRYRQVLRHFRPCGSLADLGSGDQPRFLRRVRGQVGQCWGLDPAATPGREDNMTLLRADVTKRLPFEDGQLDQITLLAVLEHVDEPRAILAECRRCLKAGGRLIATTPSRLGIYVHEIIRRLGLVRDVKEDEHRDFAMSSKLLARWLTEAGLLVETSYSFELGLNVLAVGIKP